MRTTSAGLKQYNIVSIPFEDARQFRTGMQIHPDLVSDAWDGFSNHFAVTVDDKIIATYRIVNAQNDRLPVSDHFPDLPVTSGDLQIGRLVTSRQMWTLESGVRLYSQYVERFEQITTRVYVATAKWGPFSPRRYRSLGFVETGAAYEDKRYKLPMIILVREPQN
jgi:predicted GNAT family N-acyltransferase